MRQQTPTYKLNDFSIYGSSRLGVRHEDLSITSTGSSTMYLTYRELGNKRYELSNHLGNVLEVISDRKLAVSTSTTVDYYTADVISYSDYYSFGMLMPNRHGSDLSPSDQYSFGYQGSEKDGEVHGESYTTYYRQLDTRIGRWTSIDPKVKPHESPYASMSNNPIWFNDQMGDDTITYNNKGKEIFRVKAAEGIKDVYLYKSQNGAFCWNGESYHRGNSYFDLFGDPDGNSEPTIFSNVDKSITSLDAFLNDEKFNEDRKKVSKGLYGRLHFWSRSRKGLDFDYKNQGELKSNTDESTVYEIDGIIYNRRTLGSMRWGYMAYSVYGDKWLTLNLHNAYNHQSAEGNSDEWNEAWSTAYGYYYAKAKANSPLARHNGAAVAFNAHNSLLQIYKGYYWDHPSLYKGDKNYVGTGKTGISENIQRAVVLQIVID